MRKSDLLKIFEQKLKNQDLSARTISGYLSDIAVLLWNTIKIRETIGKLKEQDCEVDYAHLKRISPLLRRHFISHGTYNFRE